MTTPVLRALDRMNDVAAPLGIAVLLAVLFAIGTPWSFDVAVPITALQAALILRMRLQRRSAAAFSRHWRDKALRLEQQFLHAKERAEVMQDWETGLRNHRQLEAEWRKQVARYHRRRETFTLVVLDVHPARGTASVLSPAAARAAAEVLENITRAEDSVYRLGGSRFAVLLVASRAEGAAAFVDRARLALTLVPDVERFGHLRVSAGYAEWPPEHRSLDEMLTVAEADEPNDRYPGQESSSYARAG